MRIIKFLIFFLCLNGFAQDQILSFEEGKFFENKVTEKAEKISSFTANFEQVQFMGILNNQPRSKGMVYFSSPGLLKWEYIDPYKFHILFKKSILYVQENGKVSTVDVSSNKLFSKLGELVAGSMNGRILKADEDFTIVYHTQNGHISTQLIPQDSELKDLFSEIWLSFNSNYLINRIQLIDPAGDYTEILLKNIEINKPIPASVFQN